jgi:hypothetical protein
MKVEIYTSDSEMIPLMIGDFHSIPRIGEHLAIDTEGYFNYYNVIKVWHRSVLGSNFVACLEVQLDD